MNRKVINHWDENILFDGRSILLFKLMSKHDKLMPKYNRPPVLKDEWAQEWWKLTIKRKITIVSPGGSDDKESVQKTWVWSLDQEDPWENGMATHSRILTWRIPRTGEPGVLQAIGLDKTKELGTTKWVTFTHTYSIVLVLRILYICFRSSFPESHLYLVTSCKFAENFAYWNTIINKCHCFIKLICRKNIWFVGNTLWIYQQVFVTVHFLKLFSTCSWFRV